MLRFSIKLATWGLTGLLIVASSIADEQKFGVHTGLEFPANRPVSEYVDNLESLGVEVARVGVNWWMIEAGAQKPAAPDWSHLDNIVTELLAADIEPLLFIIGSPE